MRHPAPAQGRQLPAGLHRRRRPQPPPAAGRGRHHQPVQLPRDGPDVVLPHRDRRRERRRAQAQREGPVRRHLDGRAVEGGRSPRRRLHRAPGRQGRGRRAARPPRRRVDQLRRLDPDRGVRLRAGQPGRQAGPGPRRRQEPHGRPPRRRPRPGRGRRGQRGLRLGRRALHGDQRRGRCRRHRRHPRAEDRRAHRAPCKIGDGTRGTDMGPLVTKVHRDKVASYVDAGESEGATLVVDGRTVDADGAAGRLLARPDAVRPRHVGR